MIAGVARISTTIRRHGFVGIAKLIPKNLRLVRRQWTRRWIRARQQGRAFDRRFGTRTTSVVMSLSSLGATEEQSRHGTWYQPVVIDEMDALLRTVDLSRGHFTFIDFGCGMGLPLLIASHYDFARIIGVELLRPLADVAESNIRIYRHPDQRCFAMEVACCDARDFAPPGGNTVYFIANPFDGEILRAVLQRVETSHSPDEEVLVFYYCPVQRALFDTSPRWTLLSNPAEGLPWLTYRLDLGPFGEPDSARHVE